MSKKVNDILKGVAGIGAVVAGVAVVGKKFFTGKKKSNKSDEK